MKSQCPRCEAVGGATGSHECLPRNYVELERMTDWEIEIEREARRLGIHAMDLARQKHAERKAQEQRAVHAMETEIVGKLEKGGQC
jgi:hypothetical protein